MKQCGGCGRYISDFDRTCPHCGHVDESMSEAEKPAVSLEKPVSEEPAREPEQSGFYQDNGSPYEQNRTTDHARPSACTPYPMRWHGFLMGMMIVVAIGAMISGIGYLTGFVYSSYSTEYSGTTIRAEDVYRAFPGLKTCDIIYGISVICIGVYEIYVRNRLHAFRKDSVKFLLLLYAATLIVNIIYVISAASVMGYSLGEFISEVDTSAKLQLFRPVLFALINGSYYNKRKALFIN